MTVKRLLALLTLNILLQSALVYGQSSDGLSKRIRTAVENENWQTATTELEKLRTADPAFFQSRDYDYLAARISERSGDTAAASRSYQTIVNGTSILSEHALWRLARLARSTGDLPLERERLRRLIPVASGSLLYEPATLRLAESFFESGDYQAAAVAASSLTNVKNSSLAREAAALMATSYARAGKSIEAQDAFRKLVMQMPDASRPDDYALTAVRELDQAEANSAVKLSEADHLLRASIYQFNRDFAGARAHFQSVIDNFPQSGTVPNAMYQLARGLYLEGKYEDSAKLFQKVFDQYPESAAARDALSYLASSYVRLKKPDQAVATYKLFIDRFPEAPNPERPYLNIIDVLHEAGRYSEALNWVQQTRQRFGNELGSTLALFAQMRIHLAQGAWADVLRDGDLLSKAADLGGAKVGGGTYISEVNFLRAFAFEQMGRNEDAINAYLAIPDGRSEYYGSRATQRLVAMSGADKSRSAVTSRAQSLLSSTRAALADNQLDQARIAAQAGIRLTPPGAAHSEFLKAIQTSYQSSPSYKLPALQRIPVELIADRLTTSAGDKHSAIARSLILLGLYDEGVPELLAARTSTNTFGSPTALTDENYTIAWLSLKGELPSRAVRFAEQLWKPVATDYAIEVAPQDYLQLLYPAPFQKPLLKHATGRNVDPRFVLSIARQESRYQADAKSIAAARGMMQFIPSTANDVAAQLKLTNFNQDDLYYPDTAILFGAQYLSTLFQQFPEQPQAVAAAYNGGADNMARWMARSRSNEADRYVPEIGFAQSKDYVFRVMTNFWNYQRLYDSALNLRDK
jgi:soluble lytic murein transglycosylase